tara:strand:- start:698 stop:934 length:237 start_codon:yes stop_codon:yes gene_type:complete
MSNYKKKTTLAKWSEIRQKEGQRNGAKRRKTINDGLTPIQRKYKKIKEAANGCWWIEQYIMGTLTYRPTNIMAGVDDE